MAFLSALLLNSFKRKLLGNLIPSFTALRLTSQRINEASEQLAETKINAENVVCNLYNQLLSKCNGRLFAIVHLCGKQYKITTGDVIVIEGYWPPTVGDHIRLDKILLVGAHDFTLFGRPMLETGLVDVQATIVEKTITHTKTHFKKKRRKQYVRINFQRSPNTMIRINSIEFSRKISVNNSGLNHIKMF